MQTLTATKNAKTTNTTAQLDDLEFKLPAFVAIQDAKRQHEMYTGNYTTQEHAAAEQFYKMVSEVFTRSKVYLTCRGKYITVKVDKPLSSDKLSIQAVRLEKLCEDKDIKVKYTQYGNTVYELTRNVLAKL